VGSVKDLQIIQKPESSLAGIGRFVFSDRYSVFDWGEMPQKIEGKGKALCIIGAYFFEKLERMGIKTHYRGLVEEGKTKRLEELNGAVNVMEVQLLRVLKPELRDEKYNYSIYKTEKANLLIPLEIIYRNYLLPQSSMYKRIQQGEVDIQSLGLKELPEKGIKLASPVLDVSTKLESRDRYLSWEEARQISGLSDEKLKEVMNIVRTANTVISDKLEKTGLINIDGKLEFGTDVEGNIIVADVTGTPDECRFALKEDEKFIHMSKEILREYYKGGSWYQEVKEAKPNYGSDWKQKVNEKPEPAPEKIITAVAHIYQSLCNAITGRKWFDCPDLEEVLNKLKTLNIN